MMIAGVSRATRRPAGATTRLTRRGADGQEQACRTRRDGGWGASVAESAVAPPGPIPNPVVTHRSAGEYCGGDPMGGEAAAAPPTPSRTDGRARLPQPIALVAGWSSGSSLGS